MSFCRSKESVDEYLVIPACSVLSPSGSKSPAMSAAGLMGHSAESRAPSPPTAAEATG